MLYLVGVLVIALGIALSIALHEIGHLLPAKLFKVRTTQYMVGFGPTLWSTRRGETEYGVKAVPLGGYVRMVGMFPPRPQDGGRLRAGSSNPFHQMIEQARADSLEEVRPEDHDRVFYRLPVWKRIIVMAGGPLMNLAISAVLVTLMLTMHGLPTVLTTVSSVSDCVVTGTEDTGCEGRPAAPARAAGLEVGDTVVAVNGTPVEDWGQATYLIQNSGERATFLVERDGARRTLTADLAETEGYLRAPDGTLVLDPDGDPVLGPVKFFGASGTFDYVPQPASEAPAVVGEMFTGTARIVLTLPQRLVDVAEAAFSSQERDPEGPMSVVGVGRVGGEIAQDGLTEGDTLVDRWWFLVSLIASLNMALFVFNLIPLLPLDGGHIVGALWEGVKKAFARVTGRPAPGPVDTAAALPVAYVVAVALLGMGVLLIYADIVKPIRLT
ncbi:M50 family metallopeptidase [Ornithinimicrobium flavum]|uniref:M50 family metallopeptidase n=1 Tax=Ornithinimicrobium flavum TaxID=1288636 RepID=UPI00107007C7|nr:site-2 protease family protein [Ornithinimicrobium flavum]